MNIDKKLSEGSKINALFQKYGIGFRETNKFRRGLRRNQSIGNLRLMFKCLKMKVLP